MNLDCNSQCVISKYFANNAMDESLSDFQESKRYCKGPVTKQKAKSKVKKVTKHIKGQKDIRTVLKKDDLITYTKTFDRECKKSVLEVDSEQLQLAIALSKSLQTENSDASTSQSLPTQGRLARIRTTLKEYGFIVPESKISKGKKHKKVYKLITTTNEERNQKVTSKYSQVLFECLDSSKTSCSCEESKATAFNIVTNITYKYMKDNEIFYVDNLIEKSTTSGCMLKDWADIPGRPVSPAFVRFDQDLIDFTKMAYSQNDLDVILSGTINSAQNVIAKKFLQNRIEYADSTSNILIESESNALNHENSINNTKSIDEDVNLANKLAVKSSDKSRHKLNEGSQVIDLESIIALPVTEQDRCSSPDLFDDEESCIVEISKPVSLTPEQKTRIFDDEVNHMDLTECVDLYRNTDKIKFLSQNSTKRKSDDFMELTDCAVSASQGLRDNGRKISVAQCAEDKSNLITTRHKDILSEDICFSQNKDNNEQGVTLKYIYRKEIESNSLDTIQTIRDNIDLTQSSNEEEDRLPCIKVGGNDKCDSIDLTQSSGFVNLDDLPKIKLAKPEEHSVNLDDTIILKEEDYAMVNNKSKIFNIVKDCPIFDLTQVADDSTEQSSRERRSNSKSFYDDFVHDHSDDKENVCSKEFNNDRYSTHNTSNESNNIDLTQSSDDSANSSTHSVKSHVIENISKTSLGKRHDDTSIDYDEIFEQRNDSKADEETKNLSTEQYDNNLGHESSKSQISDDMNKFNSKTSASNSSQNDELFDLTDKELDYSLSKSKCEIPSDNYNFELGGISVMDNVTELSYKKSLDRHSLRTDVVLESRTKDSGESSAHKPNRSSPCKLEDIQKTNNGVVSIVTPNNSDYIIKTNEITPMLHYESMTTPQRNKELDKYGLRPFKRKRAIQILTHLYNQTHPIIESVLDDEQPSPKKPRQDYNPSYTSPKKLLNTEATLEVKAIKSPAKLEKVKNIKSPLEDSIFKKSKSPRKVNSNRKENSPRKKGTINEVSVCGYEVTSEIPIIKHVDCNPDDWVFQKREKAKIHSCRVPLHIAFHNYVSSRRGLREAILKYEPVNIDVIHKDLVSYGHRYDPKELLKFLDKKCITVKTDNNGRNKR